MSTQLQENLADNIIKNAKRKKPHGKGRLVESSGYGVVTAKKHTHIILKQKGVIDALEARGFSTENAKRVVGQILDSDNAKDNDRLRAADMIFEVHGDKAPVKSLHVNVDVQPTEEIKELAHGLIEIQRQRLARSSGTISESVGGTTSD